MHTCYRCGRQIPDARFQLRRKVRTGEWVRRRTGDDRTLQVQVHYGKRVVCANCARSIDWEYRKEELKQYAELVAALLLLLGVLVAALLY